MILISLAVVVAIYWFLAYREARRSWWMSVTAVMLLTITASGVWPETMTFAYWAVAINLGIGWGMAPVRRRFIARPLLRRFSRVLPPVSETEREALEAGSVWWDAELFTGRPDWQRLLAVPPATLSREEQAFLDGPVDELCRMLDDWQITHGDRDLSPEAWRFIKQHRFFGMIVPKRYDGLEFSAYAHSQVVMKLASRSITAGVTVMVPNSLGPAKLLLHYGTQEQRDHYLPRLARGEEIPCFALTGPEAGSDASAMPDTGIVAYGHYQGERMLGIRLNWEKRYITLGPVATLIGLAFKLHDPDHLLGDKDDRGITVALIPRDTPGVEIGERHIPLDIPFQNGPNRGRKVFVPLDHVIGGREGVGRGWRMLMESLAEGRSISLPSLAVGAAKLAARYSGAYARIRRQFNQPIGRFEGVQEALARIAGYAYQMDAARTLTLEGLDCGEKPSVISAIVKYHLTERYRRVINDAMDIHGGSGICLGPANIVGRAYQAIPISITVEGANILTRSLIIFGQGAMRCHPWVLREFHAVHATDKTRGLAEFDHALRGHTGFLLGNLARTLWLGLTRGRFSSAPVKGPTRRYYQHLNWISAAFALCADAAMMTLGSTLKRKERLSARLGDVLSELYLASATLKRFEDQGRPADDLPLLQWALEDGLYRMQERLRSLLRNLPMRPLGWVLRLILFPSGYPHTEPRDRSATHAAELLLSPSATRDRLTEGIYTSRDPREAVGRLERALDAAIAAEPVERTLRNARHQGQLHGKTLSALAYEALSAGLIGESDLRRVEELVELARDVIDVDAFASYGRQFLREIDGMDHAA